MPLKGGVEWRGRVPKREKEIEEQMYGLGDLPTKQLQYEIEL